MSVLTPRSEAHHFGPTKSADHWVYRCYDAEGDLLYIGCTASVKSRMAAHRRGDGGNRASRLLSIFMVRHEVAGPFPGREAGRTAEAEAIRWEDPPFNIQERGDISSQSRNSAAVYLVAHGRRDLAVEFACTCWRETRDANMRDMWCAAHEGTDLAVFA